jgi:hypothetical protein
MVEGVVHRGTPKLEAIVLEIVLENVRVDHGDTTFAQKSFAQKSFAQRHRADSIQVFRSCCNGYNRRSGWLSGMLGRCLPHRWPGLDTRSLVGPTISVEKVALFCKSFSVTMCGGHVLKHCI